MRRLPRLLALAVLAFHSAACTPSASGTPAVTGTSSSGTVSPAPASVTATAATTSTPRLPIDGLPNVELDPEILTTVCDPEPAAWDSNAGETSLYCLDALTLGLRAIRSVSPESVTRAYLHRPACSASPCPADDFSSGTIVGWIAEAAYAVNVDARLDSVSAPVRASTSWPPSDQQAVPTVERTELPRAPSVVAEREPFPYCGRVQIDDAGDVLACFRAGVLSGRQVEMIRDAVGTEGGIVELFRFRGSGAIVRYIFADGVWREQRGTLVLGVASGAWSFDPWTEGTVLDGAAVTQTYQPLAAHG